MTDVAFGLGSPGRVRGPGGGLELQERAERQAEPAEPADPEDVAASRAAEVRRVGVPGSGLWVRHRRSPRKIGSSDSVAMTGLECRRLSRYLDFGGVYSTISLGRCLTSSNSWV